MYKYINIPPKKHQHQHQKQALFIFPTKALAQDQLASLRTFAAAAACAQPPPGIHTYDGDTPKAQRDAVREASSVLLTNPDMLHASVLPGLRGSPGWRAWLRGLRCVCGWMKGLAVVGLGCASPSDLRP